MGNNSSLKVCWLAAAQRGGAVLTGGISGDCLSGSVGDYSKPVSEADIAVMRELINPVGDGLRIPFGESKALAAAIQPLLNNREEREAMGLQVQEKRVSRFSWNTIA